MITEVAPVFVMLMNMMEMTLELGRIARTARVVHVYEHVPGSGWQLLNRVSLTVPCN